MKYGCTSAGWLSHLGPIQPLCGVIVVKSLRQGAGCEQHSSCYPNSLGHFRGEVSGGNMELGSCLSALMLAPGLAGLRLEPDCNCPSYFCNEEYMQSQAESISEEMNYQPNIDYFILRDVIQSTQLLSHSATFKVY